MSARRMDRNCRSAGRKRNVCCQRTMESSNSAFLNRELIADRYTRMPCPGQARGANLTCTLRLLHRFLRNGHSRETASRTCAALFPRPCRRFRRLEKSDPGRWRRGWDSNPRYCCQYTAFRVRRIRPLCHLSAEVRLRGPLEGPGSKARRLAEALPARKPLIARNGG